MTEFDRGESLEDQIEALEQSLGGAAGMVSAFDGELRRMNVSLSGTRSSAGALSGSISRGLKRSFEGLVFDGLKLSDALKQVANSIVNATYSAAIKPVARHFGGLIGRGIEGFIGSGASLFEKGGAFSQGRVVPFAQGGVVTGPVTFPMRGGTGLMGEAGPEAIMPLSRGADGSLGVRAEGGGRPVQVVMNITTPDAESFRRSETQVAAQMQRALGRGRRNR